MEVGLNSMLKAYGQTDR